MTRKQVEQLVSEWQNRLGLERWKVTHAWDRPTSSATNAVIHRDDTYDTAILRFSRIWESWTEEKMQQVIVHELLHLHLRDTDQVVASAKNTLHPDAWAMLEARYNHEVEGLIDRLAYRLVELAS